MGQTWQEQSQARMREGLCEAINEAARIEASRTSAYRHLRSNENWNAKEYRVRERITRSAFRRLMQIRRLYRAELAGRTAKRGRG